MPKRSEAEDSLTDDVVWVIPSELLRSLQFLVLCWDRPWKTRLAANALCIFHSLLLLEEDESTGCVQMPPTHVGENSLTFSFERQLRTALTVHILINCAAVLVKRKYVNAWLVDASMNMLDCLQLSMLQLKTISNMTSLFMPISSILKNW